MCVCVCDNSTFNVCTAVSLYLVCVHPVQLQLVRCSSSGGDGEGSDDTPITSSHNGNSHAATYTGGGVQPSAATHGGEILQFACTEFIDISPACEHGSERGSYSASAAAVLRCL